jgi:UDP-arabinose 4-epimerase
MRVLVTGGAGYIGSHTAKELARSGHEPVVLDDLSAGHRWAVKWGPLAQGDLADQEFVSRTLRAFDIEAVIHFAADAKVPESVAEPRKYYWHNVVNSLKLADAMLDAGIKTIVFSSSAATYGVPAQSPIPEDHPKLPVNPYGETKLTVERMLANYAHAYGLRWMALRYFNACGADSEGELGEDHDPESHMIPSAIQAALGQRPCVEIFGTDYPTPDGTAIRDYIHVTDLGRAHVRALEHLTADGESTAVNLGTGRGNSVREVIAAVGKMCGGRVPVREAPRRAGDPPVLVAEVKKARSLLGWTAEYREIDSIVETAWKWHVAHQAD